MSNLASDMASSGQCDFVLEIPWNSRAVRFGGCIHERLKGFHCAWVPACAWGLRTDSIGYAESGWRVVASMRSVAGLLVSRSHQLRVFLTCVADWCRLFFDVPLLRSLRSWLQEHRAHPTVLAAAKLMHCTVCQESVRMLSRPVTSGKVMEPGAVLQMDNFYWKHTVKEVHVKGTLLVDASSRAAVIWIWRTAPRQELLGNVSASEARGIVVQVSRTSRNSHDRP